MASSAGTAPKKQKKERGARLGQIRAAYSMTRKADPKVGWIVAGVGLLVLAVFIGIGFLIGHPIYLGLVGLAFAFLAMVVVFGRRAEKAAYAQVEGQPGAAAAVLNTLRRGWTVTPAVAATRNQDIVHRAIGRPGVVLVAEGSPTRVVNLLAQEKKKLGRIVPDVPVYEFQAGNEEGQVPLRKLQRTVMKLPRTLKPAQVAEVDKRLKAMGNMALPIPKGPMPRNMRMPKGGPRGNR
jgi:hypothetical protein